MQKNDAILIMFWTPLQKKPKIIGKEHCMSEISKHSTSTETMFFDKVSLGVVRVSSVRLHTRFVDCSSD